MTDMVRHVHMRELGYCNRGARDFFGRHGLSWADFLANGIEASRLVATGDGMALKVVEHAKKTEGVKRGQQ